MRNQKLSEVDKDFPGNDTICPFCGDSFHLFIIKSRQYLICSSCRFISLHPEFRPEPLPERQRYLLHKNDITDKKYIEYLGKFIFVLESRLPSGSSVLDFGSGPEPVLSKLISEKGYKVTSYDPFFADTEYFLRAPFDAILVHETAEHFFDPAREFFRLAGLTGRYGLIILRTRLVPENQESFTNWWYREDPTHVSFFSRHTLPFLARIMNANSYEIPEDDIIVFKIQHDKVSWCIIIHGIFQINTKCSWPFPLRCGNFTVSRGAWLSWSERLVYTQDVGGSNPSAPISNKKKNAMNKNDLMPKT